MPFLVLFTDDLDLSKSPLQVAPRVFPEWPDADAHAKMRSTAMRKVAWVMQIEDPRQTNTNEPPIGATPKLPMLGGDPACEHTLITAPAGLMVCTKCMAVVEPVDGDES